MNLIEYILTGVVSLVILKNILLLILFKKNFKQVISGDRNEETYDFPFVSVFIAARDEENSISACIKSICNQDYPTERYEIIAGNDNSADDTLTILRKLESESPNLCVWDITKVVTEKPGKINVLAQLSDKAQGEYFLFTDADTMLPPAWIRTMVNVLQSGYGVVTGTTLLKPGGQFGHLQNIEWGMTISTIKVLSDMGVRTTSIGNNMGMLRTAYEYVGGYRGIPFSLTEDFELYRHICNSGYKAFHIFQKEVLAISRPVYDVYALLSQRKRWMYGAFRLPLPMLLILITDAMFLPVIFLFIVLNPVYGLFFWIFKLCAQWLFIYYSFKRMQIKVSLKHIIPYEFYQGIINLAALLYFLIPSGVAWKGRKY